MKKWIQEMIMESDVNVKEEVIQYGMDIMLNEVICTLCLILLGGVMHKMWEALLLLGITVIGGSTMGGYHCNSRKCCFALTISIWLISLVMIEQCMLYMPFIGICIANIVSIIVVSIYSPVEHINKKLTVEIRQRNRTKAIVFEMVLSIMIMTFWFLIKRIACVLWIGKLGVVISMLTAVWNQKREVKNNG